MGKLTSSGLDKAALVVSGTFTAVNQSSGDAVVTKDDGSTSKKSPAFNNLFNIALWGTFVATVGLYKSYDGGVTWLPCCQDNAGTQTVYTGPVNLSAFEPELGVLYQWQCTNYTSGTVNYRISQ